MENKAPMQADHPEEVLDLVNEHDEMIARYKNGEIGKEDIPEVIRLCYLS